MPRLVDACLRIVTPEVQMPTFHAIRQTQEQYEYVGDGCVT